MGFEKSTQQSSSKGKKILNLFKVLRILDEKGVLKHLVVAGSWCPKEEKESIKPFHCLCPEPTFYISGETDRT